jgi:hypothetical protein
MEIRVVAGLEEGDSEPTVVGALNVTTWEILSEDEWQEIADEWKRLATPNPSLFEWREFIISIPISGGMKTLWDTPKVMATKVFESPS